MLGRQQKSGVTATVASIGQLRRDVMALYLDDYTRRWDALLANVALKPFGNLQPGPGRTLSAVGAGHRRCAICCRRSMQQTQLSRRAADRDRRRPRREAKAAKVAKSVGGFAATSRAPA